MDPIRFLYKFFIFCIKYVIRLSILFLAVIGIAAIIAAAIIYLDPQKSLVLLETKKFLIEEAISRLKNSGEIKKDPFHVKLLFNPEKKEKSIEKAFPDYLSWDNNSVLNKHMFVKSPDSLVFSGGGPRGVAYVGVLKYLEEKDKIKKVKRFIGTSAGSIMCTLMSLEPYYEKNKGKDSQPFWKIINDIMMDADFIDFIDAPTLKKIITEMKTKSVKLDLPELIQVFNLIVNNYALCKGAAITKFFYDSFEKLGLNKNITFKELYKKTGNHLILVACSLSYRKTAYFDYKTAPDMPVSEAMRASMAIPFIYEPVKYNDDYFVDGGTSNNYPINYFDYTEKENNNPVECLGFVLTSKGKILHPEFEQISNAGKYTFGVFRLLLENTSSALYTKNVDRTVFIDCGEIGTASFEISKEEKQKLINSGYAATERYFRMQN